MASPESRIVVGIAVLIFLIIVYKAFKIHTFVGMFVCLVAIPIAYEIKSHIPFFSQSPGFEAERITMTIISIVLLVGGLFGAYLFNQAADGNESFRRKWVDADYEGVAVHRKTGKMVRFDTPAQNSNDALQQFKQYVKDSTNTNSDDWDYNINPK